MKNVTFDQLTAASASLEVAWLIGRKKMKHTIDEELIKPVAVKMGVVINRHSTGTKIVGEECDRKPVAPILSLSSFLSKKLIL